MIKTLKIIGLIVIVASFFSTIVFFALFLNARKDINIKKAQFKQELNTLKRGNMKLTSSAFAHNESISSKYTCDGENVNPRLVISNIPEGAKSLALIVDDPDAPMGTWVHWTVWNITPYINEISENSVPNMAPWNPDSPATPIPAIEGITDFGKPGYGGPCPPSGIHRYFFKLYALDTILELPQSTKAGDIEKAMQGHILKKTELIGLYKRK